MRRLLSFMRRRIGALNLHRVYPPFDYVSNVTIHALDHYTKTPADKITDICVVGVHNGDEVHPFLRRYPNAHLHLYEPSARYLPNLERRFRNNPRVTLRPVAASDASGTFEFFETNRHGSGSLLQVGAVGRSEFGLEPAESHPVETVRLDDDIAADRCNCLWIDVQGAEMMVLRGAQRLLENTDAVAVEVATDPEVYQGGCDMDEISDYLRGFGFRLALLGMDGVQGNALYVRTPAI